MKFLKQNLKLCCWGLGWEYLRKELKNCAITFFFFLRNQLKCCLDMNSSIDIKGQESCLKKDLETLSPLFQSTWQN